MDVKTVMFAALGLIVSGTATMVWVGNDMERIRAEERAELKADCTAAAATLTSGTPAAGATTPLDDKLAERCLKLDIDLNALTTSGAAVDPAATAAAQGTAAVPATNPGIAPDPSLAQPSTDQPSSDPSEPATASPAMPAASETVDPATSGNSNTSSMPAIAPAADPSKQPATVATPSAPNASRPSDRPISSVTLS